PGYDEVTGLGTPKADLLVPDLAAYGLPDQLVVSAQPQGPVTAGSPFGLTIEVESPSGRLLTDATGTVTIAMASGPGGAALGGTRTSSIIQGGATFSGLTIDLAGEGYSLMASAPGIKSVTSSAFDVVPAAPTQLVINAQPPPVVTAGSNFGMTV